MGELSKKTAALLVATSVLLTSVAQILFRSAMSQTDVTLFEIMAIPTSLSTPAVAFLAIGALLYGTSMLLWMFALTRFPVSLAYPMLSLSYIMVYVAATSIPSMGEVGSMSKALGVGLVVVGVSIMSIDQRSDA